MKIVILTTDNRGQFKDYAATSPSFGTAPEALLQGFASLPEAEVHVVSCIRQPVSSPEKLAPNIYFHSLLVPKIGWMRSAYVGCIRASRKKIKEIRPDIVHGQGTELDCSISAVFSNFPNVLTIHGNMNLIARVNRVRPFSFLWLAARLESFTLPRSQGVVCITNYTREAVSGMARRTWVVPNAVDASFFDVNAQPFANGSPRVLCVGHVCVRKNQNAFIRALDSLAKKRPIEVLFLGKAPQNDPYADEFLSLVRARPWCTHAGFADRAKLKTCLQGTTLLALPSIEDNCPMVVLEAMAAGVPVMAANVGGLPDLIQEGKTGFFCDPLDPESMRASVEKVLADPAAAIQAARQAKLSSQQRFHPLAIARRHLEIYAEVLNSPS